MKQMARGTGNWKRVVLVDGAGYRNEDLDGPFATTRGKATRFWFNAGRDMRDALRAAKLDAKLVRLRPRDAHAEWAKAFVVANARLVAASAGANAWWAASRPSYLPVAFTALYEFGKARGWDVTIETVVFVYGSLLRGLHNHRCLGGATFLGAATTLPSYTMFSMGAYPGLLLGGTTAIVGECYAVDAAGLARLDRLEGHPRYYLRTRIDAIGYPTAQGYVVPQRSHSGSGGAIVPNGDWRAFQARPMQKLSA